MSIDKSLKSIAIGQAQTIRKGQKIAILAFGSMVAAAIEAGNELNATVVNMRFIKPLDNALIAKISETHDLIVTIEENTRMGGAGSGIAEYLLSIGNNIPIKILGLPDSFLDHGEHQAMLDASGLCSDGIINTVRQHFPA